LGKYGAAGAGGNRAAASVIALVLCAVPAAADDTLRLVALGDSLTQGYGLSDGNGFVPQLETWLRDQGADVEVVNAGVSGDTTAGGLARMDWTLADPVDAMLVTLGGNDLLRGINPKASRENLDAILARLDREGVPALLAGMPAPGNYGPDYQRAFEAMYIDLAAKYDVPLYPDFLAPITDKSESGESFADLMQDDNIHPDARGLELVVEGIGPAVLDLLEKVRATEG